MENSFTENEMVIVITSLLAAARSNLNSARKYKDTDSEKHTEYIAQARERILLYRKIADNSNGSKTLNGQMDKMVEKYTDICSENGIV